MKIVKEFRSEDDLLLVVKDKDNPSLDMYRIIRPLAEKKGINKIVNRKTIPTESEMAEFSKLYPEKSSYIYTSNGNINTCRMINLLEMEGYFTDTPVEIKSPVVEKKTDSPVCTCPDHVWMNEGCQCGAITPYKLEF